VIRPRSSGAPLLRIGHGGLRADGRDAVELDVVAGADGRLLAAHEPDQDHAAPALDDELARLPAGLDVLLDLKGACTERAAAEALRRHGLLGRALVSSCLPASLVQVAELEPTLPRVLGYPRDRLGLARRRVLLPLVVGGALALRATLHGGSRGAWRRRAQAASRCTGRSSRGRRSGRATRGTAVLAWTVDRPSLAKRLEQAGIDGIITNNPRIFEGAT
jgi:glycerophosphoryl diester phosphodiesterase